MSALAPWHTESSRTLIDLKPWFTVIEDTIKLPSGRIVNDFYRIEAPDYVLISARRDDGCILMERHYKQCLGRTILTSPAGGVDNGEEPLKAAQRELLEETGLASKDWQLFNVYHPFRRILWDIYVFVARDCYSVGKPRPEAGEKIKLQKLDYSDFVKKITRLYWEGDLVSEILQSQQDPRRTRSLRRLILKK